MRDTRAIKLVLFLTILTFSFLHLALSKPEEEFNPYSVSMQSSTTKCAEFCIPNPLGKLYDLLNNKLFDNKSKS